ncbi:MAG: DUF169 domain-containing protein [Candidatus Omnitrophica bacterium]|nr:DUF169 domain-containing protein [Candidatus Omnitrophota bacterium]MDD5237511.1 DUF169 domain-containing protein [Candidatus Omnitrophota bacterium]
MKKEWQDYALILKEVLNLEFSPVAVACLKEPLLENFTKKVRICKAILGAANGEVSQVGKANNACFGASLHLGFQNIKDAGSTEMVKKFVVEGEKLFSSYQALEALNAQLEDPPDNSHNYFLFSPLETAQFCPQLVVFVVNAEASCRLLTLAIFLDGVMPKIKIGGSTCRMSITYPLLTQELNISFYDYTARKICSLQKDKLIITIPYSKIPKIVDALEKCSAGSAKAEFLPEFKEFLQKKLNKK